MPGRPGASDRVKRGLKLQTDPRTQLDLPARRGRFGDAAELRGIYKAVRRPQIRVIESVKELGAELEAGLFGDAKVTNERKIERLPCGNTDRTGYGIAGNVSQPERPGLGVQEAAGQAR